MIYAVMVAPTPPSPRDSTPLVANTTFAVVDVETTGFFARANDRIVEIAVIRVDARGRVLDEFVTLIHPERDVGATHVHGIETEDVEGAPVFGDIAGDVVARLAGSVFVAHNVRFDLAFVEAEFHRFGHPIPPPARLCTIDLARRMRSEPASYKLADVCAHFGVTLDDAHSALGDARATARLFHQLMQRPEARTWRTLADLGCGAPPAPSAWPRLPAGGNVLTR
jgi:DNA polymerase III epsilon subunit family exonuclease